MGQIVLPSAFPYRLETFVETSFFFCPLDKTSEAFVMN